MVMLLTVLSLVASLVGLVCAVIILIAAFKEAALQGILSLCVPFYILYYGFARFEHEKKPMILKVWIGAIAAQILCQIGMIALAG